MPKKNIYITEHDAARLRALIASAREFGHEEEKYLKQLELEINRSLIVKPKEIPSDIITMNSEIHLIDLETNEETVYKLVFPDAADPAQGRISILAPIGTALLGYQVGDIIDWEVPAGNVKFKIERITYQPEAAGDYNL